jgi:hypothetical protein
MRIILFCLFFLAGCATKYILPGNRFITPETQGGILRGQIELQQTNAPLLAVKADNAPSNSGVEYSDIKRTGFLFADSLFERFDLVWSHTGSANSMLGGKFQILGGARTANATGHKIAVGALFGGNDYDTDGPDKVEFTLQGREYLAIYGYRFTENILVYTSVSKSSYEYKGVVKSADQALNGFEPYAKNNLMAFSGGAEFSFDSFFGKLEGTYQQISTTKTGQKDRFCLGYSVGIQW